MRKLFVVLFFSIFSVGSAFGFTEQIRSDIDILEDKFDIKFQYKKRPKRYGKRLHGGRISYRKLRKRSDGDRLELMLGMLKEEFLKYPDEFFTSFKIKEIVFVKNLTVYGSELHGGKSIRYLVPDVMAKGSVMYVSIYESYFCKFEVCQDDTVIVNEDYLRDTIHHEIFHLVDPVINSFYPGDPSWTNFNTEHSYNCDLKKDTQKNEDDDTLFLQISNMKNAEDCEKARLTNHFGLESMKPGFLTAYSTVAVEEDKAEMFMFLMRPQRFESLVIAMYADDVIMNKVTYLMNKLYERYSGFNWRYLDKIHGREY